MDLRKAIYFTFVFCSLQSVCLGCGWIRHRFRDVNSESLSLLKRMGGDYTTDTMPVPFPSTAYRLALLSEKTDRKIAFLSHTMDKIRDLFSDNMETVTWNKTELEHFKVVLHRQSHELHRCVSSNSKHEWKLKTYFRTLHKTVLKEMKHSAQSWELVRKAVERHLEHLDLLASSIKM
ncbi:interferon phi 1 isoform X13 [Brienomyrus brachyistius]|uniref:interferon phi 1 isoform X11 n=1 Tax=Brienomyrus brachyistius TaxID=42636 RepID=UPI0020B3B577|nr:interferon phi 1 isoform X11 [Brienomyrus brachyistius]XP_048846438.1 interferon phi 1 isoform X12 [Brienomyrus brachyistius]XP_048846439.1 interferon phi 1 isoform X13 [Brienomyrus brachyistius]